MQAYDIRTCEWYRPNRHVLVVCPDCNFITSLNLYGNGLDGMKLQSGHTTRTWRFERYHSHVCISYACIVCIFFYLRILYSLCMIWLQMCGYFHFSANGCLFWKSFCWHPCIWSCIFWGGTRIYLSKWWVYFLSCFVCFIYDDAM